MKHIKLFELYTAIQEAKTLYRWVGQAGLFIYFYGDIKPEEMRKYMFDNKKIDLPLNPIMDLTHYDDNVGSICMTVDPNYLGEPYSGDSVIRLNFDFDKMKTDLDISNFEDLTTNGEAEVRYGGQIIDWPKYITKIDILEEYFKFGIDDDFGDWSPCKNWFPKEYLHLVKLFKNEKNLLVKNNKFDSNLLRM